ncbi:transmembrane cell adhesion receptor mua-3 [Aphelenchoides avenae]|nr:transmembrane cell adhesion receptor mua-3 [Aphelenchus avenae]
MTLPLSSFRELGLLCFCVLWSCSHCASDKWIPFATMVKHSGDAKNFDDGKMRQGYNKCESGLHECSPYARCIGSSEYSYRCECFDGFMDFSAGSAIPGSTCLPNICANRNFCPSNSTCTLRRGHVDCQCLPGYVDLRYRYHLLAKSDSFCISEADLSRL